MIFSHQQETFATKIPTIMPVIIPLDPAQSFGITSVAIPSLPTMTVEGVIITKVASARIAAIKALQFSASAYL